MRSEQASYIDIHCHCLYALDDGPSTLAESLALFRALANDDISCVIATPHQLGRYGNFNENERIREQVRAVNEQLSSCGVSLSVKAGADVRVDERICQLIENDKILTLADGGKYILLELPHEVLIDIESLVVGLASLDIQAVISHPERHFALAKQPEMILKWLDRGAHLQVTTGSLLGDFGDSARIAAWRFLKEGWVSFVATDAHNLSSRRPCMRIAFEQISKKLGREAARLVCIDNPLRVLESQDVRPFCSKGTGKFVNEDMPVSY